MKRPTHHLLPFVLLTLAATSAHGAVDILLVGTPAVSPVAALAGGRLQITYVVRNNGDQPAAAIKTRVQIFTPVGTQYSFADFPIAALAAGQQRTETHTLTLRTDSWSGTWEVSVRLDTEQLLSETSTSNNTTTRTKFQLTATLPDLTFAYGSRSVYQDYVPRVCPAAYGTTLHLGFDIKNDSTAAVPPTRTRVEIRNRSNDVYVQDYVVTPAIPAGMTVPFLYSIALPATGTAGNWSVFLVLNDFNEVTEASGFNNSIVTYSFPVAAAGTAPGACPIITGAANPRKEGSQFVMELSGIAGTSVTIQTSTNLTDWSTHATVPLANGLNRYTTPMGTGKRFFRVR